MFWSEGYERLVLLLVVNDTISVGKVELAPPSSALILNLCWCCVDYGRDYN